MTKITKLFIKIYFSINIFNIAYGFGLSDPLPSIEIHFENLRADKKNKPIINITQSHVGNLKDDKKTSKKTKNTRKSKKTKSDLISTNNESKPENFSNEERQSLIQKPSIDLLPLGVKNNNEKNIDDINENSEKKTEKLDNSKSELPNKSPDNKSIIDTKKLYPVPPSNIIQEEDKNDISPNLHSSNNGKPNIENNILPLPKLPDPSSVKDSGKDNLPIPKLPEDKQLKDNNQINENDLLRSNTTEDNSENLPLPKVLPLPELPKGVGLAEEKDKLPPLPQLPKGDFVEEENNPIISNAGNLVGNIIFPENESDIKKINQVNLEKIIQNLPSDKKIKILAYLPRNEAESDMQIINLQRLIAVKTYLLSKNIKDDRINTSIDNENLNNNNTNQINIFIIPNN